MELHVKTLYLINVAVTLLSAVSSWYFWRQYRENAWLLWWSVATGLFTAGVLLLGVFGPAPPAAIGPPAVTMLFVGYALIWQSMRVFNGRQPQWIGFLAILAVLVSLQITLVAYNVPLRDRAGFVSGALAIFAALSAYEVSRNSDQEFLRTRLLTAALFALMTLVLAGRTLLPWLRATTDTLEAFYDPLEGLSSLANSIIIVGLSISLIMMAHERTNDRHRRLALTDELTGLPNRRSFLMQAERLQRRKRRAPACILMMDLDRFSKINERFGHAGGDEALIWFAGLLRRHLRRSDLVARYGGEEFCVLLINATPNQGLALAEKFRAALAAQPLLLHGESQPITVSIGLATLDDRDVGRVLRNADRALYRAKAAGRNCIVSDIDAPGPTVNLATG